MSRITAAGQDSQNIVSSMGTGKRLVLCQELIDMVVDYAHKDHDVLLSCSLASPMFLRSSRFHLFEKLHLQSSRWAPFFDLLESPLSTITRVQFVQLDFENNCPDFHIVMTRLHKLRLDSLSLADMRIEQCIDLDWEITGLSNVKQLTIHRGFFPDLFHMFNIVSMFKSVEHLRLRLPSFKRYLAPRSIHADIPDCSVARNATVSVWRTFELIYWHTACETLSWLTLQPGIATIQTVVLTGLELEDFGAAGKFFRALGPQLKYLELQLASTTLNHIETYFDLSLNNNLQSIHIILPDFVGVMRRIDATMSQALSAYACILTQIRSPSLCEIVLSEGPEMQPEVINMDLLPGVVSALKGRQFANVRRVVFPPAHAEPFKDAEAYLKTELSEWDRSGVLVFEHIQGYFGRWIHGSEL